jgi:transcriptional regulator with XRE-family HTH domain
MRSADLIREARLRAGLSQYQLADLTGRDRTVIARWEHGHVAPSLETLLELLHVCGFDLPTELVPYDPAEERLQKNALLSPERRAQRLLRGQRKAADRKT